MKILVKAILIMIFITSLSSDDLTILNAITSDFQVNDDQGSENQNSSSIAVDVSGNFIITWDDERNGIGNGDIYAQRYSSDGIAFGSNFKVNDVMGSIGQGFPSITVDGSGNFIITWDDERNGNYDIYAQRYSSKGTALGGNFQVNDDQGSTYHSNPSISTDDSGNFIITWEDRENDAIKAQRYSSDGTALGSNFKVNDDEGSTFKYEPSIAVDGSGNFIITWEDGRNPVEGCPWDLYTDIYAQRYSSDGTAQDSNFQVNDDRDCIVLYNPSISADSSGNFIITWIDYSEKGSSDISAQRYSSDGTAQDSNFQVNDDQARSAWHWYPSVSVEDSGNFIITWDDGRNGNYDIYAQRYSEDGKTIGENFSVTNTGEGMQRNPDVKLWKNLIYHTWEDNRAVGTGNDIYANVLDWDDPGETSVDELYQAPVAFVLHQNYPNPFNPSTSIEFTLPQSEFTTLKVFNILGKEVATLVSRNLNQGNHTFQFDGSNLSSGVYPYRIEAGVFQQVKKMVMIK